MEPANLDEINKKFEFFNNWKHMDALGFTLFSVTPIDFYSNCRAISICFINFELRIYY
jgi:hypothetical protein